MKQRIIISTSLEKDLTLAISECEHDKVFVLADETTIDKCWPVIKDFRILKNAQTIVIGATDTHKTLESLAHVWKALGDGGATRHSCLINLGGGMVTDLGGFAASTFKRGIDFINIPTTLLAMVDASVGGKTGINFNGLKNEVGVFNDAKYVILDTNFLKTLDDDNLRSGYAEMLKHGLISDDAHLAELLNFQLSAPNYQQLQQMVAHCRDQGECRRARPSRACHPQGSQPWPHLWSCFRVVGIEAQAYPSWPCCCLRFGVRTLSQLHQDWLPYRAYAPVCKVHP